MYKVMEKSGVYSKKNGMVMKSIKVFESENFNDCQDYVFDKYGEVIKLKQTITRKGLLSNKYITIK